VLAEFHTELCGHKSGCGGPEAFVVVMIERRSARSRSVNPTSQALTGSCGSPCGVVRCPLDG